MNVCYVALGGALGCICRYSLSAWMQQQVPGSFPWGTFTVNIAGSLLIGFLYGFFAVNGILDEKFRMLAFVGFLGGFTTFSSFTLETMELFRRGLQSVAICYVLASNIIGLVAVFGGFYLSRLWK